MTLIELLVTIVILVTLLAGVLPLVSPNNDSRKIREASRQLVSLLTQAQAQAARDGRSVGVGYNEFQSWTDLDNDGERDEGDGEVTGNGMALSAYIVAEPPPFTGYSSDAAVGFVFPVPGGGGCQFYAPLSASTPTPDLLRPGDPPLVNIAFGNGVGGEGMQFYPLAPLDVSDGIPAKMFRGAVMELKDSGYWEAEGTGDVIQIGKELFEIVLNDFDDVDDDPPDNDPDVEPAVDFDDLTGGEYLRAQKVLTVRWLTWRGRPTMAESGGDVNQTMLPRGGRSYRIRRQPTSTVSPSRTTAEAIQFPRNVGIDLDPDFANETLSIVFAPNGTVEAIFRDGRKEDEIQPVFIMLGRVENSNPRKEMPPGSGEYDIDYLRYDFRTPMDDDELAERRTEVNLLNGDSRWVVVTPSGRILTAENALFDPRLPAFVSGGGGTTDDLPGAQRERQRDAAQEFARNYQAEAGG
jgi:type II secretory pathway pseudopilin PulG